jgi:hypothetical protein
MSLETVTEKLPGEDSANIGAIRTTVNVFVLGLVAWVVSEITGKTVDTSNPLVLVGAPLIVGFGYRVSRLITHKWPSIAWLLFGIGKAPDYSGGN